MEVRKLITNRYVQIVVCVIVAILLTINFSSNMYKEEIHIKETAITKLESDKKLLVENGITKDKKIVNYESKITNMENLIKNKEENFSEDIEYYENGNIKSRKTIRNLKELLEETKKHEKIVYKDVYVDKIVEVEKIVYKEKEAKEIIVEKDIIKTVEIPMKKFRLYSSLGYEYDGEFNNNFKIGSKYDINSLLFISIEAKNNNINEFSMGNSSIGANIGFKLDL